VHFDELVTQGLAPGTTRAYANEQATYRAFCDHHNLSALPSADSTICAYLAFQAMRGLAASTISHHLSAIRDLHIQHRLPPPSRSEHVRRALAAVERLTARRRLANPPPPKLTMSPDLVQRMIQLLPFRRGDGSALLAATMATAVAGLLRPGEIAGGTQNLHDPPRTPLCRHLERLDGGFRLRLPVSKTDQLAKGQYAYIGADFAVAALVQYIDLHPTGFAPNSPLWQWPSGNTLEHSDFLRSCYGLLDRLGIPRSSYASLNWRAGGATALFGQEVPEATVKLLGRWRSDAVHIYNQPSPAAALSAARAIGRTPAASSTTTAPLTPPTAPTTRSFRRPPGRQ
jgi:hypothetical protein